MNQVLGDKVSFTYRYLMTQTSEVLLEGSYLYYQKELNYSQENFKLIFQPEAQTYQIQAEVLSRIETGEFLKIIVHYEMNQQFLPHHVRIEKSIGNKHAQETYTIDPTTMELHYTFRNSTGIQDYCRVVNSKHYLTSPAVCTSAIFTLSRKFDASGRTPVVVISSDNDWSYEGPPTEKIIFCEFKSRELADFKLNGTSLSASHLCLHETDSMHAAIEQPVDLYLSKHWSVPYQLVHGDQKIVIKNLKRNSY